MKKIYLLLTVLFALFVALLVSNINVNAVRNKQQINFINSTNSDYFVFYYGESNFNNDFYYLNKTHSAFYQGVKMKTDILMIKGNTQYNFCYLVDDLKENEIVISKNLALSYDINKGDAISLKSAYGEEKYIYIIKDFISPCFGISVDYFSDSMGLVIIGNNNSFNTNLVESVVFVKDEQSINSLNINKLIAKNDTVDSLQNTINLSVIINDCLILIGCILICILILLFDRNIFKSKVKIGFSLKKLYLSYPLFYLLLSFIFAFGFHLFTFLISSFIVNNFVFIALNLTFFAILFIMEFLYVYVFKYQIRRI
ncbi:MAG: hypothetical protein ACI4TX_00515 [Christensenellales bacterium]